MVQSTFSPECILSEVSTFKSDYLNLNSLELATWWGIGGGGKFWQHVSLGSAHITFAALASLARSGGGGGDGGRVLIKKHVKKYV